MSFTDLAPQPPLRAAITAAFRAPEAGCVAALLARNPMSGPEAATAEALARRLVAALRARPAGGAIDGLMREYDLSSQEGVALMCLAEALLRIPDSDTRDALIRDKLGDGDWRAHLGQSPSVFVNAATWGLVVTGRLVATGSETGLGAALTRLIGRGGEPVIRAGVDLAMRMLGEQFVTGETIEQALARARKTESRGYRHSYDMLGEAATTAADAERYLASYQHAIHAIGGAAAGRGFLHGPGISVKLSALHPRYTRSQRARVMAELLPRLRGLALLARRYDIGLNIDAEEADRLDLSLDLLEALCLDRGLAGWNGIGFVVQAYQKRAPFVLEWLIDLARRSGHRLMLRLVKGAYWDSEIKRAQQEGLAGFPVFTRKQHTDVSYLACARILLDAPDAVFPQFATHNAQTLAAIHSMAGPDFHPGQYEFQCLHGMGEPLYDQVVGPTKLDRPCRIYAPVGTHETLLAYLVRRLLENGANSSFVNRIADPDVPIDELVVNPLAAPPGTPHPRIGLPRAIFGGRPNSAGLDLASEAALADLTARLALAPATAPDGIAVLNPADHADLVGRVESASAERIDQAIAAAASWGSAAERAAALLAAADRLEARMPDLLGLIIREAGKTAANAIGEVREAVDFLRYYATEARDRLGEATPLGPVACISPWNFPLSIFTGQVAAALAAGNPVLAKPAEQTPLIAEAMVAILHQAGVPASALHLLHGAGETGARLVADPRIRGVVFTGSTEVARLINTTLALRLNPGSTPVPLIAETGGQNAMVVDSSALAEQVVADVLTSAFDSAGQRCSALRVLCLQDDVAGRVLTMLKGALAELRVGNPLDYATDIGPVIDAEAAAGITAHVAAMRAVGCPVHTAPLPEHCAAGSFVAPAIIELADIAQLKREVFGPVLHVLRFRRDRLGALLASLATTGYALTFGVHSRIDETIARAVAAAPAGNIYVNRSIIGAAVGCQPFGGHGLSGTGPKAGGPLYLRRLTAEAPPLALPVIGTDADLPGPVGERNRYRLEPRGTVLCVAASPVALAEQEALARATGNSVTRDADAPCDVALFDGPPAALTALAQRLAARPGPIIALHARGADGWRAEALLRERAVCTNTTAAGGNASLMMIG